MTDADQSLSHWIKTGVEPGPDLILFGARFDIYCRASDKRVLRRLVLDTPDWCAVVALTPDGDVVLVTQYRFGVEASTLEVPGGNVDPGEDSEQAARRELLEETGYVADRWTYLGNSFPNPAFHNNRCHYWLAENASAIQQPRMEEPPITVRTLKAEEVRQAAVRGDITHSLGLVALSKVFDLRVPPYGA